MRVLCNRGRRGEPPLSAHLDPVFANGKFALSFDMQINDKETSWKRNNIHAPPFGARPPAKHRV
jgi:5-carboxymethyl-2-hydroxymuconate isomerase